jgi:hypothetical protein
MSAMPFIPTRPVFVRPVFVHLTLFNFNDEASRWFGAATSSRETPPGLLYTGRQLMPLRNSASHTMYLMSPPPSRSFHFPVFVWLGIAALRLKDQLSLQLSVPLHHLLNTLLFI